MRECQVSPFVWVRQMKGRLEREGTLQSRPLSATCQTLVGHRFGGVIMGGKFETLTLPLYNGRREEREGLRTPSLSRIRIPQSSATSRLLHQRGIHPSESDLFKIIRYAIDSCCSSPFCSFYASLHHFYGFLEVFICMNSMKTKMNSLQPVLPSPKFGAGWFWSTLNPKLKLQ